jgi:GMP synthase (glutamine-hydrolysing)
VTTLRLLAIENTGGTPLGLVEERARLRGAEVTLLPAYAGAAVPADLRAHDALVILGGPQDALDDAHFPHMPAVVDLIRSAAAADKAVLGICLGAQLMARALGGTNILGRPMEFGYHEIVPTPAAAQDPVFASLCGAPATTFQWHVDSFELPAGAVHLAASRMTVNQAFRMGRAAYGFQFHVEASEAVLRRWSVDLAPHMAKASGPGWCIEAAIARHGVAARTAGTRLVDAWLDQAGRRGMS